MSLEKQRIRETAEGWELEDLRSEQSNSTLTTSVISSQLALFCCTLKGNHINLVHNFSVFADVKGLRGIKEKAEDIPCTINT